MKLVTAALAARAAASQGLADHVLVVPSDTTARIQEMHITLGQMLVRRHRNRAGTGETRLIRRKLQSPPAGYYFAFSYHENQRFAMLKIP